MTNVKVFENSLGELRVVEEQGTAWFVAKDVCDVLELTNTTMALQTLDSDERSKLNLGRQGETNVINESGLYSLILGSRKPQAKAFRKWVTSEVLPSIRRDGGYMVIQEEETEEDLIARALILAQKSLQRKAKQLEQAEQTLEVQAPKVEYHDKVLNIEGYMTIDETAKELGLRSAQQLNQMLKGKKVIKRSSRGSWLHRAGYEYLKDGYINYKPIEKKKLQMLVSQKGVKEFARLLDLI
ncbi:phage repressor protein/antirepressor Ant [Bacillus wiedmannii]|uniref:phage antirepressor KilAC domain-containing protein n=1 Tax=Bacillus wiedmannii TaxID=1890302 RepID=UPI000BF45C8A|nr:phage antirepressor KilAC domain-containing protein [Bacillus wiedmannii]PEQ07105.1 phage repressor protein/antirepressor Ant [Bacillus wiedmannii]